mmetsp:Transcript_48805/g.136611  ORF Transcript_48805/g.136611 Transcript_48805/m.136611 type:complete len:309 (+) Transcript_48805:74-1000(+)
MVFFVYMGGGLRGMAVSAGICLISVLLNSSGGLFAGSGGSVSGGYHFGWDPFGAGPSSAGWDTWDSGGTYHPRQGDPWKQRRHRHMERDRHRVAIDGAGRSSQLKLLVCALGFLCLALCCIALLAKRSPALARLAPVRWALQAADALQRRMAQLHDHMQEVFATAGFAEPRGGRQRERADTAHVRAMPSEVFVSREELQTWSAPRLKDELRRLQRVADLRLGFSGGAETKETHRRLCHGLAMEKSELVCGVLKARGGDSGMSCAICLVGYTSGDCLRVLPCGHRFHSDCVDRWLTERSRTCPLCSKRI